MRKQRKIKNLNITGGRTHTHEKRRFLTFLKISDTKKGGMGRPWGRIWITFGADFGAKNNTWRGGGIVKFYDGETHFLRWRNVFCTDGEMHFIKMAKCTLSRWRNVHFRVRYRNI